MACLFRYVLFSIAITISLNCSKEETGKINDPHSYSNPDQIEVTHMDLDLKINFESRKISGQALLYVDNHTGAKRLILDINNITIKEVTLGEDRKKTKYQTGQSDPFLGQELIIEVEPTTQFVKIEYETNPGAAALQWLTPEQTTGGEFPFLFTQSQAILARTWIPCQDTPEVRMTYTARVVTSPDLMAVMSAENPKEKSADGVYRFNMPQPIPSYLLALAVGDFEYKDLGERSGVYAESKVIRNATWEFADTEEMIRKTEKLYGPYRWGRYDIIVLPPSFPFGGMENPRLTFVTPTILAGDRSLVSLIAHELAHSWSGNLVTNANWNDFWLNEGFTTYIEHRIMEEIYGKNYAEMLAVLSFQDLQEDLKEVGSGSEDSHLKLDLEGRDPDAGMTSIAYDKGHYFLRTIENIVGRDKWDRFLRAYFDAFAFTSITSEQFVAFLQSELIQSDSELEKKLKIDEWIYGPGIPENIAMVSSDEFEKVEHQLEVWRSGTPAAELNTLDWTTHHWLHFLRQMQDPVSEEKMKDLDSAYNFTKIGNSEILHAWLLHVIANKYEHAYSSLEDFLTGMGRRKFLVPLYRKMVSTPELQEMAKLIYRQARPMYHPLSVRSVDEILNWK